MRTRRSLLNFATMILFTVVTMATGLVATPWLERWLGKERFGAYRIITGWYGYLALLELGLGGALSPLLARAVGRGDDQAARATLAMGARAFLRVSFIMLAVGLSLTAIVAGLVAGLPEADVPDLRRAWAVGLLGFLSLGLVPFRSIIEARQLGSWINLLLTGQAVVITATALLLARSGWGITGQTLSVLLGTWAFYLAVVVVVARGDPGMLRAVWSHPDDPATRRAIWGLSLPTLMISLSGRVSLMTDDIVIGGLLSAAMVTTLAFTQRLALMAQALLQGIGGATWAALAELHARGEHETFNRRLIELTRLIAVLGVTGLGPIVAYNHHFFALWVLDPTVKYGGDAVIAIAALNAYLLAQQSLWAWCFTATGQARRMVIPSVAAAALNLVMSVALTHWLGLIGPLLGTTVAFLAVGTWCLPWMLHRVFGTRPTALLGAATLPLAWGLLFTAGLGWLARHQPPLGWFGLAAEMSAAALGFLLLSIAFLLSPTDRDLWRTRLRSLLR